MLFIDMEGQAHLSTDEPVVHSSEPVVDSALENFSDSFAPISLEPEYLPQPEAEAAPEPFAESPPEFEPDAAFPGTAIEPDHFSEPAPESVHGEQGQGSHGEPASASDEELDMDNFLGFQDDAAHGPASESEQDVSPADSGSLDISKYANSEISQAKDGPLVMNVLISGIDSKEMRQSIREAIEDSRFGWDAQKLMSRINNGRLKISGLSPVKASILISRIKRLPIEIRWEQNAITQMEGS
jgi:hypothetical protein